MNIHGDRDENPAGATQGPDKIVRIAHHSPFSIASLQADAQVLGKQLLRCGISVAANYRAVCRARSKAEFVAKIGIVVEEADETILWLELLTESGIISEEKARELLTEARELTAIFTASQHTARSVA